MSKAVTDERDFSDPPTLAPVKLKDGWRASQSAQRSDPETGEKIDVEQIDPYRVAVQLGDGSGHVVTAYRRRGRWHGKCSCPAHRRACAHLLAVIRRHDDLPVTIHDVD